MKKSLCKIFRDRKDAIKKLEAQSRPLFFFQVSPALDYSKFLR